MGTFRVGFKTKRPVLTARTKRFMMSELPEFLTDVVLGEGKPIWRKLFDRLGTIFDKHFGPDWKKKNQFLKDFKTALRKDEQKKG